MCLAIPGKLVARFESGGASMGTVDFGGVRREACLVYLPEAAIGDYVIVHAGFAISRLDEAEAARTLQLLREVGPGTNEP